MRDRPDSSGAAGPKPLVRIARPVSVLLVPALLLCAHPLAQSKGPSVSAVSRASARVTPDLLTLDLIATDPSKWIGTAPSQIRWSEDGRSLYFMWNPEAADVGELYTISRDGGTPAKVPPEQRRTVPTADGKRNKAETLKVYDAYGDIFLYTVATGSVKRLTDTDAGERNPGFTFDQKAVTFERDQNLFAVSLDTGEVRQITNFKTGKDPEEKPKQTKLQEYLEKEQLE
ncbi:MAG: hypothetical protein ACRD1T_05990, partial [Acidimicrobiia bacterium]